MTFLLGRQAIFGQEPPMYFRSTTAVRLPSLAIVQAINLPAVPLPSTRTSYFSALSIWFISLAPGLCSEEPRDVSGRVLSVFFGEEVAARQRGSRRRFVIGLQMSPRCLQS